MLLLPTMGCFGDPPQGSAKSNELPDSSGFSQDATADGRLDAALADGQTTSQDASAHVDAPGPIDVPSPGDGQACDTAGLWSAAKPSWDKHCASCHGKQAQGGIGPPLDNWQGSLPQLIARIDLDMPPKDPPSCTGVCAESIAHWLMSLKPPPPACARPPRVLRLLSRREYRNTVADLLPIQGKVCAGHTDCTLPGQSCAGGHCVADPCGTVTFLLPDSNKAHKAVVVAGSFNSWAPTADKGGWPMAHDAASGRWWLKKALGNGEHQYKLVADGATWITDPANPIKKPDGFGGHNSALNLQCQPGAQDKDDPTAGFAPDSRPHGFAFDNHAATATLDSVRMEAYLAAGRALAKRVGALGTKIVQCDQKTATCADQVVGSFGLRAFRRPLTSGELARYRKLVLSKATIAQGAELMVAAMLCSPHFLYRPELGAPQGGVHKLNAWELASALSYALWGTMPDEALLDAAKSGALLTAAGWQKQVQRLLDDGRARQAFGTFAAQWLGADQVLTTQKKPSLHPEMTPALRSQMREETQRFAAHVAFDGSGAFTELWTAKYTIATAALAQHYELAETPKTWAKVPLAKGRRAGLLGHASVLATTAHSDQSSPIRRGLLVRERVLCQELGPPPPNAGGVPEVDPNATTKERFAQHTADPFCKSCHQYIDGIGFGFERFDAVGKWRTKENGHPIDGVGELNDVEGFATGTQATFSSLPQLGGLVAASDAAQKCFVQQVFRRMHGRKEGAADACELQAQAAGFMAKKGDIKALLRALVSSPQFRERAP